MWNFASSASAIAEIAAYTAVVLNIAVYAVRTMVPLRLFAIAVNVLFIVYSALEQIYPTLLLNGILLPLNIYRLYEMLVLTRRVKAASESGFDFDWLRPFATRRKISRGTVLFRKGDVADAMFLVISGAFKLPESGTRIAPGTVVGEMGMLSPGGLRTQGLVCEQDGEILEVSYTHFKELYFQNPQFGFYFLRLITHRLFENNARLEQQLATRNPAG